MRDRINRWLLPRTSDVVCDIKLLRNAKTKLSKPRTSQVIKLSQADNFDICSQPSKKLFNATHISSWDGRLIGFSGIIECRCREMRASKASKAHDVSEMGMACRWIARSARRASTISGLINDDPLGSSSMKSRKRDYQAHSGVNHKRWKLSASGLYEVWSYEEGLGERGALLKYITSQF